jgi:uncharacterized membrane protein YeaQ/YmgE (transglycosylase-associated protein family)
LLLFFRKEDLSFFLPRQPAMSLEDRLATVFERALPKLGPEARVQIAALMSPTSLAIIAGVIVTWVVSHAVGVGELLDIVVGVVGVFSIGLAVFSGIDELFQFAKLTVRGTSDADFDQAATHLARAIAILGIQVVLALLFKRRPGGGRLPAGEAPPRTPGLRYKPSIVRDPALPAGEGATTFWGDVEVSTAGSAEDQAVVLLHEKVHQFLAPKLYVLRQFRVENRVGSYFSSSLYRYVEEALAETIAQVGTNGFTRFFAGVKFPVGIGSQPGYVYLVRAGGFDAYMKGAGLLSEGAGLLGAGAVQGFAFELWFRRDHSAGDAAPAAAMSGAQR